MRMFITGGNGMVGRNLRYRAGSRNVEIIALDRAQLNLLDSQAVATAIKKYSPDIIVHCAGMVGGIQANIAQPFEFFYTNMQIGLNLVSASHQCGIEKLVNLGSSCMYPRGAHNPLKEDSILEGKLEPTNEGYAIAKIAVAKMCEYLSQQYQVNYKTLIPCNLYGYWDDFSPERSHMIPAVIRKIDEAKKAGLEHIDIWGDGKARREFMFASDLADLILEVVARLEDAEQYMNVGLGIDYSINDYYSVIAKVVGYDGGFKYDLSKPAGMPQKLIDISKQREFGWTPPTDILSGLEKTYDFYRAEYC